MRGRNLVHLFLSRIWQVVALSFILTTPAYHVGWAVRDAPEYSVYRRQGSESDFVDLTLLAMPSAAPLGHSRTENLWGSMGYQVSPRPPPIQAGSLVTTG